MSIITVQNLGKKYVIGHHRHAKGDARFPSFRESLTRTAHAIFQRVLHPLRPNPRQSTIEEFWALRDIDFKVHRGDRVGIIGRNGAGKSTLLKILSRITEPTTGRIEIDGRVASLLEVGTGFHPELSGRENIFLNGAILGMSRAEIRERFDEIVAFADIERFLDTPVKRYSSGMYVRLAFSVAAHLETEILIVDEVLAVGDAQFQKKCLGKMKEVGAEGRTVLFVSHNMSAVKSLTGRCMLLESGSMADFGRTPDVVERYMNPEKTSGASPGLQDVSAFRRDGSSPEEVEIVSVEAFGGDLGEGKVGLNVPFAIRIVCFAKIRLRSVIFNVIVKDFGGSVLAVLSSWDGGAFIDLNPGENEVRVVVENPPFAPGKLHVDVGVGQSPVSVSYDVITNYPLVEVVNSGDVIHWLERPWGPMHLNSLCWHVNGVEISG